MSKLERVFITGASGMIGAHLTGRLADMGCEIMVLSRPNANRLRLAPIKKKVTLVESDLLNTKRVLGFLEDFRADTIFHLASSPFNPPTISIADHFAINTAAMLTLIEAQKRLPNLKIIYTGSAAVYGSRNLAPEGAALAPATMLGASKAAGSILLQSHSRMTGQSVIELRLFTPYGPLERPTRLIPSIIMSAMDGRPVKTSAGFQKRDFLFIDDLLSAMIAASKLNQSGPETLNIGTGVGVDVRNIVSEVLNIMGNPVESQFGALPTRSDEIMEMCADISRCTKMLEWRPKTELRDGLAQTVEWTLANKELARQLV